jgi:hypothetical protein
MSIIVTTKMRAPIPLDPRPPSPYTAQVWGVCPSGLILYCLALLLWWGFGGRVSHQEAAVIWGGVGIACDPIKDPSSGAALCRG